MYPKLPQTKSRIPHFLVSAACVACSAESEEAEHLTVESGSVELALESPKRYSDIEVTRCGAYENGATTRLLLGRGGIRNPVWMIDASRVADGLYRASLPPIDFERAAELCEEAPCLAVEYLVQQCQGGAASAYPALRGLCIAAGFLSAPCAGERLPRPERICALATQFVAAVLDSPIQVAASASLASIGVPGASPLSTTSRTVNATWNALPDFLGSEALELPCECNGEQIPCSGGCVDLNSDIKNCGRCSRACSSTEACVGGECVCIPKSPAQACPAEQDCGTAPDGCDGEVSCGACVGAETCGGAGVKNQCGAMCPGISANGAPEGCFSTREEAVAAACAFNSPDTTSDPAYAFYRDSCVFDSDDPINTEFTVHAHWVHLASGATGFFSYGGNVLAPCEFPCP